MIQKEGLSLAMDIIQESFRGRESFRVMKEDIYTNREN